MFTMQIDTSAIEERLHAQLKKIGHFKAVDMPAEMSDWQTADMHRKRPFTMRFRRAGKAATRVRPHSRYETLHMRRLLRRRIKRQQEPRRFSSRPILRDELFSQLYERMQSLLETKLRW
jgi:hypothetical protein